MDVGEVIGAIVVGFLAGLLARALLPGKQKLSLVMTTVLGIAGSFIGYLIFAELLGIGDEDKFDLGGLPGAVIGAMILLFLYERFVASGGTPAAPAASTPGEQAERRERRRERREGR
jgi:uncharacterized membrane protein YeaQ/YmgE (transglycosylase-associated protein family)